MYSYQNVTIKGKTIGIGEEFENGTGEELISYCARVSNPENQENWKTAEKLLRYCIRKKHWSVFEMADLVMEIITTRDIGRQILRHRSFSFQEFSQRYAEASNFVTDREFRLQHATNRQQSIIIDDPELQQQWSDRQKLIISLVEENYKWALDNGMAKECARSVLPEGLTLSRMYMKGSIRSWVTYILVRQNEIETQREHVDIALKCKELVIQEYPFLKETFDSAYMET